MRTVMLGLVVLGMAAYSGAMAVGVAQTTGSVLPTALARINAVLAQIDLS